MKRQMIVGIAIAALLAFGLPSVSQAFGCPASFKDAEAAIAKATAAMNQMSKGANMQLVHTLIDDAKMLLQSGIHNHEKPQGLYDHARAIAKARSAKGHAEAAQILAKATK